MKKLMRTRDGKLAGVCGGIGEYFGFDATIVRLVWVFGTLFTGVALGVIAYLACAFIIPLDDGDNEIIG